jgi:uncharacterized membrane protein YbaN (DUF454 family)
VLKSLQNECLRVWRSSPGDRFHARYRRTRRRKDNDETGPRVIRIVVAIICVGLGVAFLLLPVPSTPFFLTSGALLASESSSLAHLFDRVELRIRFWAGAVRKKWRSFSPAGRWFVAGLCFAAVIGKVYLLYRIYSACIK